MSTQKKEDITRIEDLSEFEHEDDSSFELDSDQQIPELPNEDGSIELDSDDDQFSTEMDHDIGIETNSESNEWEQNSDGLEIANEDSINLQDDFSIEHQDSDQDLDLNHHEDEFSSDLNMEEDSSHFEDSTQTFEDVDAALEPMPSYEPPEEQTVENNSFVEPEQAPVSPHSNQADLSTPSMSTEDIKNDLKKSMETHVPKHIPFTSTPAFTLKISNINTKQDKEDIFTLLKDWKIISDQDESLFLKALERGTLIIPRIGEFAGIFLAHRLRRFNVDIQLGLSQQVFTNETEEIDKGPVTNQSIHFNKKETSNIKKQQIDPRDVIISTLDQIHGYYIQEHIGLVSNQIDIESDQEFSTTSDQGMSVDITQDFTQYFEDLSQKLKPLAVKKLGNGVIGIRFQVTPYLKNNINYFKIVCTGNIVWLEKLK